MLKDLFEGESLQLLLDGSLFFVPEVLISSDFLPLADAQQNNIHKSSSNTCLGLCCLDYG